MHYRPLLSSLSLFFLPALSSQPSAPSPVPVPLRQLKWGQLNFLHTTDTHGWLAGHLQEYAVQSTCGFNPVLIDEM